MDTFINSINTWISNPDLRIFFHLTTIILLMGCLFGLIANRKHIAKSSFNRAINTFLLIIFLQLTLLIFFFVTRFGNPQLIVNERIICIVIFGISSLWLTWLWCFPSSFQSADGIKYALTTALVLVLLIHLISPLIEITTGESSISFSEIIISMLILLSLICGFLILLIKHKSGWFWGFLFIGSMMCGFFWAWIITINNSGSLGALVLAQFSSFIFLPPIIQSLINSELVPDKHQPGYELPIAGKDKKILPAVNIYKSWLNLAIKNQDTLILNEFIKNLSDTFQTDYCFLFLPLKPGDKNICLYTGVSTQKYSFDFPLNLEAKSHPTLFHYLKTGKACIGNAEDYLPEDVISLFHTLKIKHSVHILFYPVKTRVQPKTIFGFALLSLNFRWEKNHIKYLSSIEDQLVQILQKIFPRKTEFEKIAAVQTYQKDGKADLLNKNSKQENQSQKIIRLESELKLALEEYSRIKRMLEERNTSGGLSNKNQF